MILIVASSVTALESVIFFGKITVCMN